MSSYSATVIADGATWYAPCGDASGHLVDIIGGYNSVTETGLAYGQPGPFPSDPITSITFGAAADAETATGAHSAIDFADGPMSVEAWVNQSSIGSIRTILDRGAVTGDAWILFISSSNVIRFNDSSGANDFLDSGAHTLTDTGVWHHIVAQKNGTTRLMYLDGVDVSGLGANFTLSNSTASLLVSSTSNGWPGNLAQIALYPLVLTPGQVANHYALGIQHAGGFIPRSIARLRNPRNIH